MFLLLVELFFVLYHQLLCLQDFIFIALLGCLLSFKVSEEVDEAKQML